MGFSFNYTPQIDVIQLHTNAEFDIRDEAALDISLVTSPATPQQNKFIVQQGCIRPLCDFLTVSDTHYSTLRRILS